MEFTVCFVDAGTRTSKVIDVDERLLGLDANSTPEEITTKAYYLLHKGTLKKVDLQVYQQNLNNERRR